MQAAVARAGARHAAAPLFAAAILAMGPAAAASAPKWLPDGAAMPAAYVAASDDTVLLAHEDASRRQPASLSKLAVALVALQAHREWPGLLDADAVASAAATGAGGTRLGLRTADRVRASGLMEAMLVGSANDACAVLVEHVAGSAAAFVKTMNALAARLGMVDTRFVDACGFDRAGQHTSATDLLRLARAVLAEPEILRITEQQVARVTAAPGARVLEIRATNALLGRHEGVFGLKTGYTRQAGPCLVATARRGATVVVIVILGGRDRWPVAVALLDEAFDRLTGFPRVRGRSTTGEPD